MIVIKEEPDIQMTREEYLRYKNEYDAMMMCYAGPHITLESFIRSKNQKPMLLEG